MRLLIVMVMIIAIAATAFAADVLTNAELAQIVVLSIKEGKAVIRNPQGEQVEVVLGDRVGKEHGTVAEIGKSYVILSTGATRMKLSIGEVFKRK